MEPFWNRNYIESVQITMAERIRRARTRRFLRSNWRHPRRDPKPSLPNTVQSCYGASVRIDSETIRDEKVKVLKAIRPLEANNL